MHLKKASLPKKILKGVLLLSVLVFGTINVFANIPGNNGLNKGQMWKLHIQTAGIPR